MAATFVVETGAGVAGANSYVSVADADQYFENYTNPAAWTALASSAKQEALRMGTQYLDALYGLRWKGQQVNVTTQPLDWPRYGVCIENWTLNWDVIPQQLKDATCEAALRHINETAASSSLMPDLSSPGSIKRTRVKLDVIEEETEYAGSSSPIKRYPAIDRLLKDLVEPSGRVWLA